MQGETYLLKIARRNIHKIILDSIDDCKELKKEDKNKVAPKLSEFLLKDENVKKLLHLRTVECKCFRMPYDFCENAFSKDLIPILDNKVYRFKNIKRFDIDSWVLGSFSKENRNLKLYIFKGPKIKK